MLCGHTHMPFVRLVDRRLVVIDRAIAQVVEQSTYPDRRKWAEYLLRAVASDAEALMAFALRDGRPSAQLQSPSG